MKNLIGYRKNLIRIYFLIIISLVFLFGIGFLVGGKNSFYKKLLRSDYSDYNVVVISLTALRPDHLSFNDYTFNDYKRVTSPNIDNLARHSLIFRNAYTVASWTLPSGISLFSGLYPFTHGVMNRNDGSYLNEETITIIEVLKALGYKTAAFTGGFDYDPIFGLTNRFEKNFYSEPMRSRKWKMTNYDKNFGKIASSTKEAIDWLKVRQTSKPFFLFIQGYDTHCPFTPNGKGGIFDPLYENKNNIDFSGCIQTRSSSQPKEINSEKIWQVFSVVKIGQKPETLFLTNRDIEHLVALYDEEIYEADKNIGNLLETIKELGMDKNTIIILLSEHGDYLGENGQFMRGGSIIGTFGEEAMRIPLIISIPNVQPKVFDQLVSIVDMAPTIADILGVNFKTTQGISFYPLIRDNAKKVREAFYGGSIFSPRINNFFFKEKSITEMIKEGNWKLIKEVIFNSSNGFIEEKYKLYNLQKDPNENISIASDYPSIVKDLKEKLNVWRKSVAPKEDEEDNK